MTISKKKRNKDDNLWSSVVCLICLSLFLLCNYNLHINTYFCPDLNQLMTNSCFTIATTSSILSPSNYKLAWKNIGKCYYVLSISMTSLVEHQFLVYKITFWPGRLVPFRTPYFCFLVPAPKAPFMVWRKLQIQIRPSGKEGEGLIPYTSILYPLNKQTFWPKSDQV